MTSFAAEKGVPTSLEEAHRDTMLRALLVTACVAAASAFTAPAALPGRVQAKRATSAGECATLCYTLFMRCGWSVTKRYRSKEAVSAPGQSMKASDELSFAWSEITPLFWACGWRRSGKQLWPGSSTVVNSRPDPSEAQQLPAALPWHTAYKHDHQSCPMTRTCRST